LLLGSAACAHHAAGPARLTGRVIDARGKPVFGVEVVQTLNDSRRTATTNLDGVFVLPPLPLTAGGQFVVTDDPMGLMEKAPVVVRPAREKRLVVIQSGVELHRFGPDATRVCTVGLQVMSGGVQVARRTIEVPLDEGAVQIDDIRLAGER
jgi:hypothetical protein